MSLEFGIAFERITLRWLASVEKRLREITRRGAKRAQRAGKPHASRREALR
jgi:hypothetical protein